MLMECDSYIAIYSNACSSPICWEGSSHALALLDALEVMIIWHARSSLSKCLPSMRTVERTLVVKVLATKSIITRTACKYQTLKSSCRQIYAFIIYSTTLSICFMYVFVNSIISDILWYNIHELSG